MPPSRAGSMMTDAPANHPHWELREQRWWNADRTREDVSWQIGWHRSDGSWMTLTTMYDHGAAREIVRRVNGWDGLEAVLREAGEIVCATRCPWDVAGPTVHAIECRAIAEALGQRAGGGEDCGCEEVV